MDRTAVLLGRRQRLELKRLSQRDGISLSEHIRRAVDLYLLNIKKQEKEV
jgi:hypothetical protein